jgi:AmpD protein
MISSGNLQKGCWIELCDDIKSRIDIRLAVIIGWSTNGLSLAAYIGHQMNIIQGWLSVGTRLESPNTDNRPSSADISLLVIHNISLPPDQFGGPYIGQLFSNCLNGSEHPYFADICHLEVSSHLLIDRDGEITQFVPFDKRAWHAGVSEFEGHKNCNDFSIGIELEGSDNIAYTNIQYSVLAKVTTLILADYPAITRERIVGHSDIAPGRKTDPGPAFDWLRYKKELS